MPRTGGLGVLTCDPARDRVDDPLLGAYLSAWVVEWKGGADSGPLADELPRKVHPLFDGYRGMPIVAVVERQIVGAQPRGERTTGGGHAFHDVVPGVGLSFGLTPEGGSFPWDRGPTPTQFAADSRAGPMTSRISPPRKGGAAIVVTSC